MLDADELVERLRKGFSPGTDIASIDVDPQVSEFSRAIQAEEIKDRRQDRVERKTYAKRYYKLAAIWVNGMMVLLILQGLGWINLDSKVLMMALGTTTANIIGILIVVANYLFKAK